jgi:putative ABC transport system permease protein
MVLLQDVRFAWRDAVARPWFTAAIVVTLALGIGANAAVFSIVDALLLRPLPFYQPDRLVRIASALGGGDAGALTFPEWRDVSSLGDVFAGVAAYTDLGQYNASGDGGPPDELASTITTHNLFEVLGTPLKLGRTWPASYDATRHFSVVISDGLWTRRFGRDPDVLHKTMTLDGADGYEIVGVAPPGLTFPSKSDLFRSSGINPDPVFYERRTTRYIWLVARLRPSVSFEQAQGALDRLAARLEASYPDSNRGIRFQLTPLRDLYVGRVRAYVLLLLGAVGLVLLLACTNVANLLLSRALARRHELAIRAALGASRAALVRRLLVESTLLAALGATVGIVVAATVMRLLTTVIDLGLPAWMALQLDWRALAALGGAATLSALVIGLLPASRLSHADLTADLKTSGRGSSGGRSHQRTRHALVAAEAAVATALLVGAMMMVQTVRALQRADIGFSSERLLTFRVELGWRAYDTLAKSERFYTTLMQRLAERVDVEAVAIDSNLALSGKPREPVRYNVEGQSSDEQQLNPFASAHWVSPNVFSVLRIPIVEGRAFTDDDREKTAPVAIVSRRWARRMFGAASPVGKRIAVGSSGPWRTIVGVVADVQHQDVTSGPGLDVYAPYRQTNVGGVYVLVRARRNADAIGPALSSIVWSIDPNQSFFDVRSMDDRIAALFWHQRTAGWLFGGFALLALVLASTGLYAVLSYAVSQQARELAVRIALGAGARDVAGAVVRRTSIAVAAGLAAGLVASIVAARFLAGVLVGAAPPGLGTFIAAPLLFAGVAGMASFVPVRRALRVDPVTALYVE